MKITADIPAVDTPRRIFGLRSAGSPDAVLAEVETGAPALAKTGEPAAKWFRGATAQYSPSAIALIRGAGFKIAGFPINGDGGSLLGARETARRVASARDGDVIIAHINQPTHAAGGELVKGLLGLKAKGLPLCASKTPTATETTAPRIDWQRIDWPLIAIPAEPIISRD